MNPSKKVLFKSFDFKLLKNILLFYYACKKNLKYFRIDLEANKMI